MIRRLAKDALFIYLTRMKLSELDNLKRIQWFQDFCAVIILSTIVLCVGTIHHQIGFVLAAVVSTFIVSRRTEHWRIQRAYLVRSPKGTDSFVLTYKIFKM